MVKIRLRRVGAKGQPHYRVVVADARSPRDGRFIEAIGHYNPRTEPSTIVLDEGRVYHWLGVGAQPSDSVRELFRERGVWERWARRQAGEPLEVLLEEAGKAVPAAETPSPAPAREPAPEEPAARREPEAVAAAIPIETMGLSTRTANLLSGAGISTREDLEARLAEGEDAVVAIPGLGPKALEEIRAALAAEPADQAKPREL
ncbi:MAG: 30S ribosomal protein S16 [Anaerolineae bacterium]